MQTSSDGDHLAATFRHPVDQRGAVSRHLDKTFPHAVALACHPAETGDVPLFGITTYLRDNNSGLNTINRAGIFLLRAKGETEA